MRNLSNIVIIGPMGAGKTSIGKALANRIAWNFYDSDQVIEDRAGVDLLWIYDLEGNSGFMKREAIIIEELMQKSKIILSTGGNTIANPANREQIKSRGLVIYLSVSLDDQLVRTGYSKKRPLALENAARLSTLKKLHEEYLPIYEQLADITYHTDNKQTKVMVTDLANLIQAELNIKI